MKYYQNINDAITKVLPRILPNKKTKKKQTHTHPYDSTRLDSNHTEMVNYCNTLRPVIQN